MIKQLKTADYITLLNLISGLLSIYFSFQQQLGLSAALIIFAVVFDKIDGYVARALKQENDLGIQLDSFSDLVSFGVAPAALFVNSFTFSYLLLIGLLLPICGTLRLARFNITKKKTPGYFIGVPITVNGLVFPLIHLLGADMILFSGIILIMSYLMISNIKIKKVL